MVGDIWAKKIMSIYELPDGCGRTRGEIPDSGSGSLVMFMLVFTPFIPTVTFNEEFTTI